MGGWAYLLMTVNMLLFWGLLVAAAVVLARYLGGGAGAAGRFARAPGDAPEQILARRLARGEIDEEEYERRLSALHTTGR
jgi:putative membrane protein